MYERYITESKIEQIALDILSEDLGYYGAVWS